MTMFTRNEKDPGAGTTTPTRDNPPAPAAVEPKRAPATAHPLSAAVTPTGIAQAGVSVISKALKITGQLESTEDIRIDGQVEGDVRGVSVTVGSGAKVKGTVYGEQVEVAGTVEGRIEAKKVVLASGAHMAGDIVHQDIRIESGAYIDGNCKPEFGKGENKGIHAVPKPVMAAADKSAEGSKY